jgi:hypothetical protein
MLLRLPFGYGIVQPKSKKYTNGSHARQAIYANKKNQQCC